MMDFCMGSFLLGLVVAAIVLELFHSWRDSFLEGK